METPRTQPVETAAPGPATHTPGPPGHKAPSLAGKQGQYSQVPRFKLCIFIEKPQRLEKTFTAQEGWKRQCCGGGDVERVLSGGLASTQGTRRARTLAPRAQAAST